MYVRRVGELEDNLVFLLFVGIGCGNAQLEAVNLAPEMGVIINVDRSGIVFKTTYIEGFLTHADSPLVIKLVLQVEEIGVVKKTDRSGFGNDTLAQEIGDMIANIAAKGEVEILTVEAVVAVPASFVHVVHGRVVGIQPLVGAQVFQVGTRLQVKGCEAVFDFLFSTVRLLCLGEKWKKNQ